MRANQGFMKLRSPVAATVAAWLLCGAAQAGTLVSWVGGDGDWQDTWHWSTGTRPGANDDVSLIWGANGWVNNVSLSAGYTSQYGPAEIGSLTVGRGVRLAISSDSLKVNGGILNDGELALGANYFGAPDGILKIAADTTITGTGTVSLGWGGTLELNARTLTVGGSQTVRGYGLFNNGNLVNQGLLVAETNAFSFTNVATVNNSAGRISIAANGALGATRSHFTGGRIDTASGGSIAAVESTFSKVTFGGDAKLYGTLALVDAINEGTLRASNSGTISARGSLTNEGNIRVDSMLYFQGDAKLTGGGAVWLKRDGVFTSGILEVAENSSLTIDTAQTVRGSSLIRINANSRIVNRGSFIAEGGSAALTRPDGTWDNSAGHITVAHDGTFGSYGTLILGDDSTLTFDVGSSAADHGMMYLQSGAPQLLDGTLQLNIGYSAEVGDSFTLLSFYGGEAGTFDQVIATGYTVSTSYNANDVTVTITGISPVPEPASWLLAAAGLVALRRRLRKQSLFTATSA